MEWNHVGVFPYLMKFRKTVFDTPEYDTRSNKNKLNAWKLSWRGFISWKLTNLTRKDMSIVIDGMIYPLTDKLEKEFVKQLVNPVKSMIIIPNDFQIQKIWWLDKMIIYYPHSKGTNKCFEFTLCCETKLSPVDLKKISIGNKKPFLYPVCLHTGRHKDDFNATKFERTSNTHKPFPHCWNNGDICLGNYADDVEDSFEQYNPAKLAAVLIEYVGRFNPKDGLGQQYTQFMTTPPRCCSVCGSTAHYLYDIPTGYACSDCYYLQENCRICGGSLTRADRQPHFHDNCIENKPVGWTLVPHVCNNCGATEELTPYVYIDNKFCYLCNTCAEHLKFEHRSQVTRWDAKFERSF